MVITYLFSVFTSILKLESRGSLISESFSNRECRKVDKHGGVNNII